MSANLVLIQVDRFRGLYRGRITCFLDFWGTLRSDLSPLATLLSRHFPRDPQKKLKQPPIENLACFDAF